MTPPSGPGYGKGWVAVSGQRNGPIQGNLFYADSETGTFDSATIWDPSDNYPTTFAFGKYNGCARIYGVRNLYYFDPRVYPANECTVPGARYNHNTNPTRQQLLYCTNRALNRLCTPRGAYDDHDSVPVTIQGSCPVVANIGAQMFTGSARAVATPHHYLPRANVAVGANVRYVTKNGQWALAKFPIRTFPSYPDLRWAFVPTVCGF